MPKQKDSVRAAHVVAIIHTQCPIQETDLAKSNQSDKPASGAWLRRLKFMGMLVALHLLFLRLEVLMCLPLVLAVGIVAGVITFLMVFT